MKHLICHTDFKEARHTRVYHNLMRRNKILVSIIFFLLISIQVDAQTVKLHYLGKNEKIIAAVAEANKILSKPEFYIRVDTIQRFDNSTYSGLRVSNEIKNLNRVIEVEDYWKPWGSANAKTVSVIKLNTAKLKRSHSSITNTIVHETVHAVDWWVNKEWDYTHDGNSPNGQDNTAPWVIGAIAEDMAQ
jgi:hypothetical protein